MLTNYGYIGLYFVAAVLFTLLMLGIPIILRFLKVVPHHPNPIKNATFECGVDTIGKTWVQFNFRYYIYALLYVVFAIETVFLYPWAVYFRQLGLFGLIEITIFLAILVVGYVYAWQKRILEWR